MGSLPCSHQVKQVVTSQGPNKMTFRNDMPDDAKAQESRRGIRVNSRVPVVIEWDGQSSTPVREKAHTCVVNCYGCLLVAPQELSLEQQLRVTNLANERSIDAVVVWKGKQRVEGWELGVELVNPDMEFWGVEL